MGEREPGFGRNRKGQAYLSMIWFNLECSDEVDARILPVQEL